MEVSIAFQVKLSDNACGFERSIGLGGPMSFLQLLDLVIFGPIAIVIGVFVFALISDARARDKKRRAEYAAQERAHREQILSACNDSVVAFENIPKDLMTAEELLNVADAEFQDSAFSLFWDSIEKATYKLGAVDAGIKLIADCSNQYKSLSKSYKGQSPPFPVNPASAHRLATANDTVARLNRIVRKAHRNFQFATIFEQRKTSRILIDGFTNLGEAIVGLGGRLERSIGILGDQINDLSSSMSAMNENVIDAVKGASSAIKDADGNAQAAMADQAARQERAVRMLDNIQRGRVPSPHAAY
jgi:hypothetical protein